MRELQPIFFTRILANFQVNKPPNSLIVTTSSCQANSFISLHGTFPKESEPFVSWGKISYSRSRLKNTIDYYFVCSWYRQLPRYITQFSVLYKQFPRVTTHSLMLFKLITRRKHWKSPTPDALLSRCRNCWWEV